MGGGEDTNQPAGGIGNLTPGSHGAATAQRCHRRATLRARARLRGAADEEAQQARAEAPPKGDVALRRGRRDKRIDAVADGAGDELRLRARRCGYRALPNHRTDTHTHTPPAATRNHTRTGACIPTHTRNNSHIRPRPSIQSVGRPVKRSGGRSGNRATGRSVGRSVDRPPRTPTSHPHPTPHPHPHPHLRRYLGP